MSNVLLHLLIVKGLLEGKISLTKIYGYIKIMR